MFFTLKELVGWLHMTAFEIWLHIISIIIFSVLAVCKYEGDLDISWLTAFIPLFACDALIVYFCIIVFIRQFMVPQIKVAFFRLLSSSLSMMGIFPFKVLLCQRLNGDRSHSLSEVMGPAFFFLLLIMVRACRTRPHTH